MNSNKTTIIVAVIWTYFVCIGLVQGFILPTNKIVQNLLIPWPYMISVPLVVVIGAFFNKGVPGEFIIGRRIDKWFGQNTYRSFMKVLKPELLFSTMCFGIGIVGFVRSLQLGWSTGALSVSGFFISGGFAFGVAHIIGQRRKLYEKI